MRPFRRPHFIEGRNRLQRLIFRQRCGRFVGRTSLRDGHQNRRAGRASMRPFRRPHFIEGSSLGCGGMAARRVMRPFRRPHFIEGRLHRNAFPAARRDAAVSSAALH